MTNFSRILLVLLSFFPVLADADTESTGPYIAVGQNWFDFDKNRAVSSENDVYLGLGYQTSEHLGFEIKYTDVGPEYYSLSSIYRYDPRNENSFYWKAGVGQYVGLVDEDSNISFGGGYEAHFNNNFSLVLGVDSLYQFSDSNLDWAPYIGFNLFFGGSEKRVTEAVIQQAPLDSDNDGITDEIDECPKTTTGISVDNRGCALDSDKDGILDTEDQCLDTPIGAKVNPNGCRMVLTQDVSIQLNVQFSNNSNVISENYYEEIKKVADFMRQYPDTSVVIEGHTDSRGKAAYNQNLSHKRAIAVMQYLVSRFNIDYLRVSAVGRGEISPLETNDTAEGRAANRRVQAEIKTSVSSPQ